MTLITGNLFLTTLVCSTHSNGHCSDSEFLDAESKKSREKGPNHWAVDCISKFRICRRSRCVRPALNDAVPTRKHSCACHDVSRRAACCNAHNGTGAGSDADVAAATVPFSHGIMPGYMVTVQTSN